MATAVAVELGATEPEIQAREVGIADADGSFGLTMENNGLQLFASPSTALGQRMDVMRVQGDQPITKYALPDGTSGTTTLVAPLARVKLSANG